VAALLMALAKNDTDASPIEAFRRIEKSSTLQAVD
jgi:hypothetical protein